ncbi:MAG TPA: RND transporter [Bacteroidetes bacterium]|nr:RND transporter [Bacteroidota bacterium]
MLKFVDHLSWPVLIFVSVLMLLAPFQPMPHFLEKLIMLKNGTLTRPIDIFDLFFHGFPAFLLVLKIIRSRKGA